VASFFSPSSAACGPLVWHHTKTRIVNGEGCEQAGFLGKHRELGCGWARRRIDLVA
jgi:hypothetical protein